MIRSPVQSAPNFQSNGSGANAMLGQMYFLKAKQALAAGSWQDVCGFAQHCIVAAGQDVKLRFFAKELLAIGLTNTNQEQQALAIFVELNQLDPNYVVNISNMGLTLIKLQRFGDAIRCFQRAVELSPDNVEYYVSLGLAYHKNFDFTDARNIYQKAAALQQRHVGALFGIAWSLQADGLIEDAMEAYKRVLEVDPKHLEALSNMIFIHHYIYPMDVTREQELLATFCGAMDERPVRSKPNCKQGAPLIIGIVSADFCQHVVCYFLENILAQLSLDESLRRKVILVAYSNQAVQDEYTQRLHSYFNAWYRVDLWSDDALIAQIKKDQVDILIDLSGHTRGNRLPVFAKKAAPLQVSWLGYWGSTGLKNMDYVLTDPVSVPLGEEDQFIEKVWRLPALRYCFTIPENVDVSPPPCLHNQRVVFGCYQNLLKINDAVLKCWAIILRASPNAILRIQSDSFEKHVLKNRLIERMVQTGIDPKQVELVLGMNKEKYLASYAEVDILLDTFPYTGGTTTTEALWMGVPTLTLAMPSMLARQGEALMINAGLPDWVARSEAEYVQKAIAWGNASTEQCQALAVLRSELRDQMRKSPVFDAKQFAYDFIGAMDGMWQEKSENAG